MRPLYLSQSRRGRCPHRHAVSVRCLFRRAMIYAAFAGCVGHAYIRAGARSDLHPVRRSDLQTSSGRCRHRPLRMHESVCSSLMPGCSICVLMRTRQDTTGGMRPLYLPASRRGRCPHRPAVSVRCLFRRAACVFRCRSPRTAFVSHAMTPPLLASDYPTKIRDEPN